jgi:hypothetical protein
MDIALGEIYTGVFSVCLSLKYIIAKDLILEPHRALILFGTSFV